MTTTTSQRSQSEINGFFDDYYREHHRNPRAQGWRALAAGFNADLICAALERVGAQPQRTVELGCGDGAVIAELGHRGVGGKFVGYEIAASAASFARSRALPQAERIDVFDGEHVPEPDGSFDLALIVNVLEHAERPELLLREAARLAPLVLVQIVLTRNLLTRRPAHRRAQERTGHVHDLDPRGARAMLSQAGLPVLDEHVSMPPLAFRAYWAATRREQTKAVVVGGLSSLAPPLAGQLFARDYTVVCRGAHRPTRFVREGSGAPAEVAANP